MIGKNCAKCLHAVCVILNVCPPVWACKGRNSYAYTLRGVGLGRPVRGQPGTSMESKRARFFGPKIPWVISHLALSLAT